MAGAVSMRTGTVETITVDLEAVLDELDEDQRLVIEARWGLSGEEPLTEEEVAEKFNWEVDWVWRRYDSGLQMLGYLWLTELLLAPGLERAA